MPQEMIEMLDMIADFFSWINKWLDAFNHYMEKSLFKDELKKYSWIRIKAEILNQSVSGDEKSIQHWWKE